MTTIFTTGIANGEDSYSASKEAAGQAMGKLGKKPDFCMVYCSNNYDYAAVIKAVNDLTGGAPLMGCTTSGEFNEDVCGFGKIVVSMMSSDTHKFYLGMGKGLREDVERCVQEAKSSLPGTVEGYPYRSAIVLMDGLSGKGDEVPLIVLNQLGPNIKIAGGAAGDNLAFKETHVFCNDRVETDAVALALVVSKKPVSIGVKHGHYPITSSLEVTNSSGNVLREVNGRPAYDIWLEKVGEHAVKAGLDMEKLKSKDKEEVAKLFQRYEFGVFTGSGYKVRWPIGFNDDHSVNFACSIPQGSVIKIMEGTKETQIASAQEAAEHAIAGMGDNKAAGAVIFDCGVRGVILQENYPIAVQRINETLGNIPFIGWQTYGEIAMEMGELSGFHNTTTAIMVFPD